MSQNLGRTLTGGIQDIAALLPLLGTDQCEKHVGSALDGGFLYAAAAPLSIFGSLGIVKIGISVLISSISIPKISISYRKFSINFSPDRWLGAKTLDNAGFKPVGTVAPLIAMDGSRFAAETRLVQILDEKHLDNPENLSIEWKSRDWNVALVAITIAAAVISGTPYVALLLQNSQPSVVHTPWIFPVLRTVGSCLAAICCQFLIQSRVISLMKNRVVFMAMNRVLIDDLKLKHDKPELCLRSEEHLRWDEDLPAEQCLWSLEQFATSQGSVTQPSVGPKETGGHVAIEMKTLSFSDPQHIRVKLQELQNEHFPTPAFNRTFILTSWIILFISLPATVAGYIGCFTLVSNNQKNGPLIWLGLEAGLSIVRILVWAWNPSFDERTDITVKVKLTRDQPFITTEKDIKVLESTGNNILALIPERQFLERITPYTGPLEQFRRSESLFLYFTLTANRIEQKCLLYMTVFDFNKRIAVTLLQEKGVLKYIDADVTCNNISREMEAMLQLAIGEEHPWRRYNVILFDALAKYYKSIMHALNRTHLSVPPPDISQTDLMGKHAQNFDINGDFQTVTTATLQWKWDLLAKRIGSDNQREDLIMEAPCPTARDQLYLGRGYEHHLKTRLMENWSKWIFEDMRNIRSDARNDCHHALADAVSDKAKWELTELEMQLAGEWTRRELSLVVSSITLEGILQRRMEGCVDEVAEEQENGRLNNWMRSEFVLGQRKRLEKERGQMKERMETEMKAASERAEREGWTWRAQRQGQFGDPQDRWEAGLNFVDDQWTEGIRGRHSLPGNAVSELDRLDRRIDPWAFTNDSEPTKIWQRFEHWHPQCQNERREMDATIKRINDANSENFVDAYRYPWPNSQVTGRFVDLEYSQSMAKFCSATVYGVRGCNSDVVCAVTQKSTTRSVIQVGPNLVESIPENDHLLYLGIVSHNVKEPAFIQRNRDRWWDQQRSNSSTFYFSPQALAFGGQYVFSRQATIAHIFIFLINPSRLRLRLLHCRYEDASVSIQENSNEFRHVSTNEIPLELRLQDFEFGHFEPGRHELELVVTSRGLGHYCLRDIHIEFFNNPPSTHSPVDRDEDGGNTRTATMPYALEHVGGIAGL